MDPYTFEILKTIQLASQATSDVCKVLISPEGQEAMKMSRVNWTNFTTGVDQLVKGISNLFVPPSLIKKP